MGDATDAYMIQDALITSGADLLPTNTRIFSSTVRYGRPFYFIGLGSVVSFFFLILICVSLAGHDMRTAAAIVAIVAFCLL